MNDPQYPSDDELQAAAAELSRNLGREVTPEVARLTAVLCNAVDSEHFPRKRDGSALALSTDMDTIVSVAELAIHLQGWSLDVRAIAMLGTICSVADRALHTKPPKKATRFRKSRKTKRRSS